MAAATSDMPKLELVGDKFRPSRWLARLLVSRWLRGPPCLEELLGTEADAGGVCSEAEVGGGETETEGVLMGTKELGADTEAASASTEGTASSAGRPGGVLFLSDCPWNRNSDPNLGEGAKFMETSVSGVGIR